jgi:voltage-gated potassium channel
MRSKQKAHLPNNIKKHSLRHRLHKIIFDADTPAGRLFDIFLFAAILISIGGMMLESVESIDARWDHELRILDWVLTGIFTAEYVLRIWTSGKPLKYVFSFYGIVDLLSILPTYAAAFITGAHSLSVFRAVRLIRVFRVLKLVQFVGEANNIVKALKASVSKLAVFLVFIMIVCTVIGTVMFLIEGRENGFTRIPVGIYWAVETLSTVGYGDISPNTALGRFLTMILMILGYAVIAVPTGLVTAGIIKEERKTKIEDDIERETSARSCSQCECEGHLDSAKYCRDCGAVL